MYSKQTLMALQLTLIRIYIGLYFLPTFLAKLGFLGAGGFNGDINYFQSIGLPTGMVIIAGLAELGAFIGLTFGLMTRIAAVGASVFLLLIVFITGIYLNGFNWSDKGWEFLVMWSFIALSFALTGGGKFSLDALLRDKVSPKFKFLFK